MSLPLTKPMHVQNWKEKVRQSFESTGITKAGSNPRGFDLDRMGERKIIMASDATWSAWKDVFTTHEARTLYDINLDAPFNEATDKSGAAKAHKFVAITPNQMKCLFGMDDFAVGELAQKILGVPPKVFMNKKPTKWTEAISFTQ